MVSDYALRANPTYATHPIPACAGRRGVEPCVGRVSAQARNPTTSQASTMLSDYAVPANPTYTTHPIPACADRRGVGRCVGRVSAQARNPTTPQAPTMLSDYAVPANPTCPAFPIPGAQAPTMLPDSPLFDISTPLPAGHMAVRSPLLLQELA